MHKTRSGSGGSQAQESCATAAGTEPAGAAPSPSPAAKRGTRRLTPRGRAAAYLSLGRGDTGRRRPSRPSAPGDSASKEEAAMDASRSLQLLTQAGSSQRSAARPARFRRETQRPASPLARPRLLRFRHPPTTILTISCLIYPVSATFIFGPRCRWFGPRCMYLFVCLFYLAVL